MINESQLSAVRGGTVYDRDGDKIGKAGEVYLDDATGRPEWVTVNTGLFGTSESFVPLGEASVEGDRVVVPFDKAKVKDAPRVGADGHLSPQEEEELYRYYGMGYGTETTTTDTTTTGTTTGMTTGTTSGVAGDVRDREAVGHDTSGPTTDHAMTRSEEHLVAGKQTVEAGRARLRKYVVTEQESVTVPVTKERVTVEREPITEANIGDATSGPTISEEEHEVVLHEERAVVGKEATPVERIRLDKETVTENQTVTDEVRKEQIDVDAGTETTTGLTDRDRDRR